MSKYVLIYTNQNDGFIKGREFRYANPDWFDSVKQDAARVVVVGKYPRIVEAYKNVGIQVVEAEAFDPARHSLAALEGNQSEVTTETKPETTPAQPFEKAPAPVVDAAAVVIPDNWEKLPWSHQDPTQTIRHIAMQITTEPVINRGQAQKIVREELERRGQTPTETQA